jgi:hypothetical protein
MAPGQRSSAGISRATAASTNAASSLFRNKYVAGGASPDAGRAAAKAVGRTVLKAPAALSIALREISAMLVPSCWTDRLVGMTDLPRQSLEALDMRPINDGSALTIVPTGRFELLHLCRSTVDRRGRPDDGKDREDHTLVVSLSTSAQPGTKS